MVADANVNAEPSHDHGVAVSDDLSHVYFTSPESLTPGEGIPGTKSLYVWHHGTIDYVAPSGSLSTLPREVTPDGNTFIFNSDLPGITPSPTGGFTQYYRYSDRDGSVECMSCAPPGVTPAESREHALPSLGFTQAPSQARTPQLSADGQTFVFTTTAALVPRDVNRDVDIYEWHNGRLGLVTDGLSESGGGAAPLIVLGISPDGSNVLFKVGLGLTGYEHDHMGQLYVARLNGGFPPPPVPAAPCAEDACQGPLDSPPAIGDPSSAALHGSGNAAAGSKPQPRKAKKKHQKKHQKKRHQKKRRGGKQRPASKHATHRNG